MPKIRLIRALMTENLEKGALKIKIRNIRMHEEEQKLYWNCGREQNVLGTVGSASKGGT